MSVLQRDARRQRLREQAAAAVHRGSKLLGDLRSLHRLVPVGDVLPAGKIRRPVGAQDLQQVDGDRPIGQLRKIRTEEPLGRRDEMLAGLWRQLKRSSRTFEQSSRNEMRRHHVHGTSMKAEVPRDLVDRRRVRVEPGEEITSLERRDQHVVGVQLVATPVKSGGISAGSCQ